MVLRPRATSVVSPEENGDCWSSRSNEEDPSESRRRDQRALSVFGRSLKAHGNRGPRWLDERYNEMPVGTWTSFPPTRLKLIIAFQSAGQVETPLSVYV